MGEQGAASVRSRVAAGALLLLGIAATGCQSQFGATGSTAVSPDRIDHMTEFNKIDTAHKGRITIDEATAYYSKVFKELDKNRDGFLDKGELQGLLPAMGARSGEELLAKLDRNWDGKLSQPEFLIIVNWLFQPASNGTELTLNDVQTGLPQAVQQTSSSTSKADPIRTPGGIPGKGR